MSYKISFGGLSDIGLVRQNNEDVWSYIPELKLFVLADGMGGHQAGEIAAREAVNELSRALKTKIKDTDNQLSLKENEDLLRRAIKHINSYIFRMGREDPNLRGMGTTVCCLQFQDRGAIYAHVGDSRIYLFRDKKIVQLTKDHSLLCELVDQGHMDEDQVADFLYKNIITKAIGTEPKVEPDVTSMELCVGDIFIMCTDGLSDLLNTNEMISILETSPSLEEATKALITIANQKGGRDNITVVLIKVENGDDSKNLP